MSETFNIAAKLPPLAAKQPDVVAIWVKEGSTYQSWTYGELDRESDCIARGLSKVGIGKGTVTALMVKPSRAFFGLVFGLFKAGAVPVMIDPGIGLKSLKTCLSEAEPEAFIGIPKAHVARLVFGWARRTVSTLVTVGPTLFWGGHRLRELRELGAAEGDTPFMTETHADDPAAILFTSGSTGVPKGALYRHRHFMAQVDMIRDCYNIQAGEVDLATFPLFALFDPALGMTTVVPEMDFTRPASVDPEAIFEPIQKFGVTNMFGSPALLDRVSQKKAPPLPTLKRVISAGAPVPPSLMERWHSEILPEGAVIHTPYGATENLPVATITSQEVLKDILALTQSGKGVCVGRPVEPNDVRIIEITDAPIENWEKAKLLPAGEVGEIVVYGPSTTDTYYHRPEATRAGKIQDGDKIRHRMGDVGYFDNEGRLWFCGRKSHRVLTKDGVRFTVPCESVFNTHPSVFRSALVGIEDASVQAPALKPVLCVERTKGDSCPLQQLQRELKEIAISHEHTKAIEVFLFHPGFPVDIRHNSKIDRPKLALWAAGQRV